MSKANDALDKMAENARELGLDYEPSAGTQVSKVWWDGEKLMAKPIPLADIYLAPQRTWVGLTDEEVTLCHSLAILSRKHDGTDPSFTTLLHQQIEAKLKEKNT